MSGVEFDQVYLSFLIKKIGLEIHRRLNPLMLGTMKILENSTGGSSIGNNKEVQTARAKNVYRQTQNFDHQFNKGRTTKAQKKEEQQRHNKGRTTKAQQRWNNHENRIFWLQQTMCDS